MPVVLSSALIADPSIVAIPLSYARIGYQKITGTITASTEAAGAEASNADEEITYNWWKPTALPATWELDAGAATSANYIGIAAHTCGTDSATITAEYWDGSTWQTIGAVLPGDDSPIMFLFDQLSETKYRISVTGSTAPRIGVIYIGTTLDVNRGLSGGSPFTALQRSTQIRPNSSESGQWLGRSIKRGGSTAQFQWEALDPDWYRSNFDPFVEQARTRPFFIAWNPQDYPLEIGYMWTKQDINPSAMGIRDYLSVSFGCEGLTID